MELLHLPESKLPALAPPARIWNLRRQMWSAYSPNLGSLEHAAAQAGKNLLSPFFEEMLQQVENSLRQLGSPARGRRLKHLFRLYLLGELAQLYEWLFERRPTSTANGRFTKFCVAILQEMQLDLTGVEDAIADALQREGYIKR